MTAALQGGNAAWGFPSAESFRSSAEIGAGPAILLADSFGLAELGALRKHELIFRDSEGECPLEWTMRGKGVLEILPDGFGFLRSRTTTTLPCPEDNLRLAIADPPICAQDRRSGGGENPRPKDKERFFALLKVDAVNEGDPENRAARSVRKT